MYSNFVFRLREALRFVGVMLRTHDGRRMLVSHVFSAMLLALMVFLAIIVAVFGLFDGLTLRRRTLAMGFGSMVTISSLLPLATMPFFSFKDVFDQLVRRLTRRRLFVNLSQHVFYRATWRGEISLHLAKAPHLLAEKYRLSLRTGPQALKSTSRELGLSLARSIRDAVRHSRRLVKRGCIRPEQKIVGATYGYLFGAARSKLGLRRYTPVWWRRAFSGVFYRYGALHAAFMYFIIHDRLPPTYDPVYFMAEVSDLVRSRAA